MAKRMKPHETWAIIDDADDLQALLRAETTEPEARGHLAGGERLARVRIVEIAPRKRKVKP